MCLQWIQQMFVKYLLYALIHTLLQCVEPSVSTSDPKFCRGVHQILWNGPDTILRACSNKCLVERGGRGWTSVVWCPVTSLPSATSIRLFWGNFPQGLTHPWKLFTVEYYTAIKYYPAIKYTMEYYTATPDRNSIFTEKALQYTLLNKEKTWENNMV